MPNPQLYDDNPRNDIILQGDIFPEIDFFLTSIEINSERRQLVQTSEKRLVSIISQTCDITDNDLVAVSPIYTIEEYIEKLKGKGENSNKISSNVGYIKNRKSLFDKFYLPSLKIMKGIIKECFVDLQQVNTVSKDLFSTKNRVSSLSHWGRQVLNYQLMWVYGRPVIEW